MRVTQGMFYAASTSRLQEGLARIFESQGQVASGKRIEKPSDDPGGVRRLLGLQSRLSQLEQFEDNAFQSRTFVDSASAALQSMSDGAISARESILQAMNGLDHSTRATLAQSLSGKIEDMVALANTRVAGRYLFAGTATGSEPFRLETDGAGRQRVSYLGNREVIDAEIGPNLSTAINVPGSSVFGAGKRQATVYQGLTGAGPGAGTDTAVGVRRLSVTHTQTVYAGGGLAAGSGSVGGDSALGNAGMNVLQLDVDALGGGTVSLNGGTPVTFDGSETDLGIEGPNGERLFLDVTAATPGFSGTVPYEAGAVMSIDGGRSSVAIDWSGSQTLVDAVDGAIVHVDTSSIRRTGEESLTFRGSMDIFTSLISIRDEILRVGEGGDAAADVDRMQILLEEFDQTYDTMLDGLGRLGTMGARLESAENRVADLQIQVEGLISDVEEVDLTEAISRMQQDETSYQAALLLTSRISQLSLLNFL